MELVNHIFLTDAFLAKGHVPTGAKRLTNYLNSLTRPFLVVQDVTMIATDSNDKILSNEALIPVQDIILAHELLEEGGDATARELCARGLSNASMSGFYRGRFKLDIAGRIRWRATEANNGRDFFVIQDPTVSGLSQKRTREFNLLRQLPYLIVNRRKLSALFIYE
ncbi:MAG: hypothetical protein AB1486_26590 [Planctomycetota bacterium]